MPEDMDGRVWAILMGGSAYIVVMGMTLGGWISTALMLSLFLFLAFALIVLYAWDYRR